jgi:hypothetical protein
LRQDEGWEVQRHNHQRALLEEKPLVIQERVDRGESRT